MVEVAAVHDLAEMLENIVKELVDSPEAVSVEAKIHPEGLSLRLYVNVAEVGQVIGRGGRTARALRTLVGAVSARRQLRCALEIVEARKETAGLSAAVERTKPPVEIEVPCS